MFDKLNVGSFWDAEIGSLLFRVRGTVILKIYWQILLLMGYTTIIVCVHNYVDGFQIQFPIALIFIMGVVTGLLLVFRTTTAYDRYWEGRCLWSKMQYHSRSLTRTIWTGVAEMDDDETHDPTQKEKVRVENIIEKLSAINLLVTYAYAVKTHLRQEYSYEEEDLKYKICHLPKFRKEGKMDDATTMTFENSPTKKCASCSTAIHPKLDQSHQPNFDCQCTAAATSNDTHFLYPQSPPMTKNDDPDLVPTNIPLEIAYYLFSYLKSLRKRGIANNTNVGLGYWSLGVLIECFTGFERILQNPIPIAYSCHLRQCVWLYLLAVPYQLIGFLNWLVIPAMGVASFALLGILSIGGEIENPFGYDDNDLPLDDFCRVIQQEVQMVVGNDHLMSDFWTLSNKNFPLAPHSQLNAEELTKSSMTDLRHFLAMGARTA